MGLAAQFAPAEFMQREALDENRRAIIGNFRGDMDIEAGITRRTGHGEPMRDEVTIIRDEE